MAKDARLRTAVVIPAHNESKHISAVISSIPEWVAHIIVVDDASADNTAAVVRASKDPRVTLVCHEVNTGVGGAMKTGYLLALQTDAELVAKIDADGQMAIHELELLCEPFSLGLADYTKGNRFYFRGAIRGMPVHRNFGNIALSFLTKVASGYWHVYDSQCGFTVARSSFLRHIDLDNLAPDYFFENSMLIQMNLFNARVVDVPTSTLYGEETSGVDVRRVILSFPPRLAFGAMQRFWRKHLVTDFDAIAGVVICALILLAFGTTFAAYHWYMSVATENPATTGTVMLAVLPLLVATQFIIQAFAMAVSSSPGSPETAEYVRMLIERGDFHRAESSVETSTILNDVA